MPVIRELDPGANPAAFFGAELRRARVAAGLTQEQLGQRLGYSAALVGKVETGERSASRDFVKGADQALPDADGLFARIYTLIQRWEGGYPSWFAEWVEAERRATALCWWEPLVVPGLVQTGEYARAILAAGPDAMDDELDQMVAARLERQAVLERPRPPSLLVVLDEAVLHRLIGSPKIMQDQLQHLAGLSGRPRVTIQVVPARAGAHAGLLGGFAIASVEGAGIVYLETSAEGQVTEKSSAVAQVTRRFDALRAVALPRDDSQDLILKVADERWSSA
jgi:transcriptional regulator with XRE-family HTH domain